MGMEPIRKVLDTIIVNIYMVRHNLDAALNNCCDLSKFGDAEPTAKHNEKLLSVFIRLEGVRRWINDINETVNILKDAIDCEEPKEKAKGDKK